MSFDLVLRNGTIVDGTGKPKYVGDVGIKQGKIAAVSGRDGSGRINVSNASTVVIDCSGRLVCPGWVDIHTHLDGLVSWDPLITPLSAGGVTTAVQGNCGVGFAPCKVSDRQYLLGLMEGVEDIPLGAMDAGMKWEWETFPEYLDALRKKNMAIDVGAMIAHGPVRAYVLGTDAAHKNTVGRPITSEEMERMGRVVKEAIEAGAMGFSSSRTLAHRHRAGMLVPGTLAPETEMLTIGRALAEAGNGKAVFEMASDFQCIDDVPYSPDNLQSRLAHFGREFIWMKHISKLGVPVSFCLGMPSTAEQMASGYRAMLRNVERANAEGCKMSAQVFTRPQGILMCWEARSHPFTESATFDRIWRKSKDPSTGMFRGKSDLWRVPGLREKIVEEALALARASSNTGYYGMVLPQSTDDDGPGNLNANVTSPGALARMFLDNAKFVFKYTSTYEPKPDESASAEALARGTTPLHVIYDWMCEEEGTRVVTYLMMGYAKRNLEELKEQLLHPNAVPGLGDTGAHVGFLTDPTSPSFLLTHWHRDRGTFPLEFVVRLHTSETAKIFSLDDRGTIEIGKIADINVINLEKLQIHPPQFVRDLPQNAGRWVQSASGYDFTIKTGVITFENGVPTGRLPGRLLNGPGYIRKTAGTSTANSKMVVKSPSAWYTLKWEAEQKVLEGLLRIVGAERLERFGAFLNDRMPLTASRL